MTQEELDRLLQRLRDAAQRISDNLLDLELDEVRMALDQTRLTGDSDTRWRAAHAASQQLWQWLGALNDVLTRATDLRGTRGRISNDQCLELTALLTGQSITFQSDDIPIHRRELLGGAVTTARCTPEELLTRMVATFDDIKAVVAAVHEAWETFQPRVNGLHASLEPCAGAESDSLRAAVTALAERLATDPLGVDDDELARTEEAVTTLRRGIEQLDALRRELPAHLERLRVQIEEARAAAVAAQAAHAEATLKIAGVDLPAPPAEPLEDPLEAIAALARDGAWADVRAELDRCSADAERALESAGRLAAECRAPIERRNELRGLLDAYRGKAHRLGLLEDADVDGLLTAARSALYTAPTDLDDAARLVRRYGDALSTGPEVRR